MDRNDGSFASIRHDENVMATVNASQNPTALFEELAQARDPRVASHCDVDD
jgi:hypothetical protein